MAKKHVCPAGLPEWLVTFGDLMSLLVTFFVLIISFSVQDDHKVQVVAGSVQNAFGIQKDSMRTGVIEVLGIPTRKFSRQKTLKTKVDDSSLGDYTASRTDQRKQDPSKAESNGGQLAGADSMQAAATLRQAMEANPDLSENSDNIIFEETPEGGNIQLVDQVGRAMFAPGSRFPYERARRMLSAIVPVLMELPNRIVISGHTTSKSLQQSAYTNWDLSADRANAARQILVEAGLPVDRIFSVQGKADVEPLFPDDPRMEVNERVTISLISEKPAVPPNLQP